MKLLTPAAGAKGKKAASCQEHGHHAVLPLRIGVNFESIHRPLLTHRKQSCPRPNGNLEPFLAVKKRGADRGACLCHCLRNYPQC